MRTYGIIALAASAAAQNTAIPYSPVPSNPGGALPKGTKGPSTAGFDSLLDPSVLPSRGGGAVCVTGLVPVTVSATNLKFNFPVPKNQTQVTEVFVDMVTSGSTAAQQIMGGTHVVNGTYNISATLCTPGNDLTPSGVQVLTHGVGFDKSYWDFGPGYSYVDVAAEHGYATFFYDRLSVGDSSKPADGVNVVQAPLEVAILYSLISAVRAGSFSNIRPNKIVAAGHSYGSVLTQAITAKYPTALDGAILTGFSVNGTAQPLFEIGLNLRIASQEDPYRFSGLDNTYLLSSSGISDQIGFLRSPGFDPKVLSTIEATKGTVTFGELFSLASVQGKASNYTKPIAVVNGANDLPFCFGNCSYPVNLAQAVFPALYPNVQANRTGTYLAPITGHGINVHYSAVDAYDYIQNFIKTQL